VRTKLLTAGGWFASEQVKFHFGRRPPNSDPPPYAVIAVEEIGEPEVESDGAIQQQFAVELALKCVGPDDAEAAIAQLVSLDPRWYSQDHGYTLTGTNQDVIDVIPKLGRLRLIDPLRGGEDQYDAVRRFEVWTAAQTGN
jgi:hypothetical protein